MRLVSRRNFGSSDERMTPTPRGTSAFRVAIANEMFVKQYLDGEPALGRHIGFGSDPTTPTPIEIVGIVSDAKYTSVRDEIQPQLFFPILEWGDPRNVIVLVRRTPILRP